MTSEILLFPTEQSLPEDYLRSNFWKCNFTSADKPLQYWILLPETVKVININAIENKELKLTTLGQYSSIGDIPYLEVQVFYEHVAFEINPSDWLIKKLAIMGETIINVREIKGKSTGIYVDILTRRKWPSGEDMVSRFTVLKDSDQNRSGANIFCTKTTCLEKDYQEYALIMLQIVANWDFIYKSNWQMAEFLFPFKYKFTESVSFFVPESWDIKFDENNSNTFSRFLIEHNVKGISTGVINVHFYDLLTGTDSSAIFKRAFSRLSDFQHTLSQLTFEDSLNPLIKELSVATGTLEYEKESDAAFLKIYIVKAAVGWYYFEVIGPRPNLENDYWEVNKRTMEIILDSFNNLEFAQRELTIKLQIQTAPESASKKNSWLLPNWNRI
jgi:hypothetical protein